MLTLKIRSRSPKSNQIFRSSQHYNIWNLARIRHLVQQIGCRQAFLGQNLIIQSAGVTLKIRSGSPKSNDLSEDLTIAPLQRYLRRKINWYKLKIGETEKGRNNGMKKYEQPDFSIHTQYIIFILHVCYFVLFRLFMPRSSGKKCYENFRYTRFIHPLSTWVQRFNLLGLSSWEKCDKNILMFENWRERKMKKIKGQIRSSRLIPVYTIHPPIVHVSTKFQPSRPHSSSEKRDETF